ncbi:methylmalonyl-CoA mutase C-terminal domain/subunit [Herbihabitans rhizosphaerae]|uniref:Methylmalonyl-CoA mutase C-terminal domain/subunit n=1 Tax=Herbihabitans rhizosphaerae TaxID=1872711 RepID=A0A4Q7KMU8_9PSEU|nr:hypothetical protein [Herbihabitans rhizosphaerae]RZS36931.1 methylmalonyl-CoA mutase C-terminal domain/subunit [Herbihabitans rhizosphaerae]
MTIARILLAAPADDDGPAVAVARALRDAGHEVVYTRGHTTAEHVVRTALQEDVHAIALAVPEIAAESVVTLLADQDADDVAVIDVTTGDPDETLGRISERLGR